MKDHSKTRFRLVVAGQVQGVGFRPTVYKLALESGLTGFVRNAAEGVIIEVQGGEGIVSLFADRLHASLPPLARITSLESHQIPAVPDESEFQILKSSAGAGHQVLISPDMATCADCRCELFDPQDRRFHYPFINCTNCGPRLTITRSIPYDRPATSMACFPQCPDCLKEYEDPLDRRFHAQPNCCPVCGPQVWLSSPQGGRLASGGEAVAEAARALASGKILAVKGLGGFHLVCDAGNDAVVLALRQRKHRWEKPLAVMAPDMETALKVVEANPAERDQLLSAQRPIVLLPRLAGTGLAEHLAPDTDRLGLMLPYTPLHHVLLDAFQEAAGLGRISILVMTSGNLSDEPITLGNREALSRLGPLADLFLFHNRDILIRCDDSVVRVNRATGRPEFFRRARGFTPSPVFLRHSGPCVLGLGPELKATICLTKGDQAFVSQHIGDLNNLETFSFYQETIEHLKTVLQVRPELFVTDLHPDYMSTGYGDQQQGPVARLQHHVAHILSVLAENRYDAPSLGLALDGAGLGTDRNIWGGEALLVDPRSGDFSRLGHFAPVAQPGGEVAAREPWRMARSYLWSIGITAPGGRLWPWLEQHAQADTVIQAMLQKGINCPQTSSCGRLFDAVAGLLGLKSVMHYEGQAAIILEGIQERSDDPDLSTAHYACPVLTGSDPIQLDTLLLFRQVHAEWDAGVPAGVISRRFHLGLIHGLVDLAALLADRCGVRTVGLSGGVMQNETISMFLPLALARRGLQPLVHALLPPNDACISLGQAMYGRIKLQHG